jgi:hypothetical protein
MFYTRKFFVRMRLKKDKITFIMGHRSILFLFFSFWDENISCTVYYSASEHKQNLRFADATPQYLGIT